MFQRPSPSWGKAANDNFILDRKRVAARPALRLPPIPALVRSGGAGRGLRPLLVLSFAGLTLVALSSAFLLGLAAVGLLAIAICGVELVRRRVWRPVKPALGPFDRRAIGY
jgi:hypothetical protein